MFPAQFSPEQWPAHSIKRSGSKLEGAGEYLKAEYREDARKDIGSSVMQENGQPVSDMRESKLVFPARG